LNVLQVAKLKYITEMTGYV